MTQPAAKNWFTVLMSPMGGHLDAAWALLASGTAPPLDVRTLHDGLPVLAYLEHGRRRDLIWESVTDAQQYSHWRSWPQFDPLQLSLTDPAPTIPSIPMAGGKRTESDWNTMLRANEAIFARLVAMGADPWTPWTYTDQDKDSQVDGFDLACALGCTPLVDLCLRHPNCPPLDELHKRKAWTLKKPPSWADEKGKPLFGEEDGLLVAAAASGYPCMVKYLLDRGWNPEGLGQGRKPLALARMKDSVQHLLGAGAQWDPAYPEVWKTLARKSQSHQETLAARIAVAAEMTSESTHSLDEGMARELLEAFQKDDSNRTGRVWRAMGDGKTPAKEADAWVRLDRARKDSPSLLLDVALFGLGRVARKHVDRCRNLMARIVETTPEHDIGGATALGWGVLLEEQSRNKPQGHGHRSIHLTIRDGFDNLLPEEKARAVLDVFRAVLRHGKNNHKKEARVALCQILDRLDDGAKIGGDNLAQGKDLFDQHFLGKKAIRAVERWLDTQPVGKATEWLNAFAASEHFEGLGRLAERLADDPSWKEDGETITRLHAFVGRFPKVTGDAVEPMAALRRVALDTIAQTGPEARLVRRAIKM